MPFIAFDCEGPITLNDNAFEFTKYIVPRGEYFFTQISRFDDYLADIKKHPGYKAGDTLKLILPFLKAFGASNKDLEVFSEKTLILLPGIEKVISFLMAHFPVFIISTSYKPYLQALAKRLNLPMDQIFCTEVDLDKVRLSPQEKKILTSLYEEINNFPKIELPKNASSPEALPQSLRSILNRLEEIFFEEIWEMDCGVFLREVNPIGGEEKAKACEKISKELGIPLKEGIYCGDSITDVQAFKLLKEEGGISLSFNGNRYALKTAEYYALSSSAIFFEKFALSYREGGKEGLNKLSYIKNREFEFGLVPKEEEAFWALVEKSEAYRRKVRGELIGALG